MLKKRRNSAPGPDGISFGTLCNAGEIVFDCLYRAYLEWIQGKPIPELWNLSWLWLLPKGDDSNAKAEGYRAPKDTRPLSGSNCTAKSFPAALCEAVEKDDATNKAVTCLQEGFIAGRVMLRNSLNISTQAYLARYSFEQAALVFLDFAAAFPSLCRDWIMAVLFAMGIPTPIIQAIWRLYQKNYHIYRDGANVVYAFLSMMGVKQGCPSSAKIFAWCSHPLLEFLRHNLAPDRPLKGYADDIYVLLHNVWNEIEMLFALLRTVAEATNLQVNIKKTIIVPLWDCVIDAMKRTLNRRFPHFQDFKVQSYAKYLGSMVGPGAEDHSWDKPLAKFISRCRDAANLGAGVAWSCNTANIYGFSTLSFVAQLAEPPIEVIKAATHASQLCFHGPYNWMPNDLCAVSKDYLKCDAQVYDVKLYCLAIRLRVVCSNLLDWAK